MFSWHLCTYHISTSRVAASRFFLRILNPRKWCFPGNWNVRLNQKLYHECFRPYNAVILGLEKLGNTASPGAWIHKRLVLDWMWVWTSFAPPCPTEKSEQHRVHLGPRAVFVPSSSTLDYTFPSLRVILLEWLFPASSLRCWFRSHVSPCFVSFSSVASVHDSDTTT